jgi:hypothetical protein
MGILTEFINDEDRVVSETLPLFIRELLSTDTNECVMSWRIDQGRDPYDEDDDENGAEFDTYVKKWSESQLHEVLWQLSNLFTGDTLRVYRVITAPPTWKPDSRHPGIYWSWDQNAAEAHWGDFSDGNVKWEMEADVSYNQIDWPKTLIQNALADYESEREIRLKENTPVNLISVKQVN